MSTVEEFADRLFQNERVLQQALARLLSRIPNHTGVQILQGSNEVGKDIIFYTPAAFGQKELNACVVKNGKITGNASTSTGARTVFNQAQQCLDTTLLDENGHEQVVKRVFVVTPYPVPPETVNSIVGALRSSKDRIQFVSGSTLLDYFKTYWPEYLAEEFTLIQSYAQELAEAAGVAKELEGLSFQYQLGPVQANIKHVYVQPQFHRFVRAFALRPLAKGLPARFFMGYTATEESVGEIKDEVKRIAAFVGLLGEWGLCLDSSSRTVQTAASQFANALTKSWSLTLSGRAARAKAAAAISESVPVMLSNSESLNEMLVSFKGSAISATKGLEAQLGAVRMFVARSTDEMQLSLGSVEDSVNKIDDLWRAAGAGFLTQQDERHTTFASSAVMDYPGSLFVIAPAGFGKTSFCRWNALNDVERLLNDDSGILPVYVPLHQVKKIGNKSFKETFLQHAGISALVPKQGRTRYDRTRVYLDGLDEVPNQTTQRQIAQITQAAIKADPTLQVIITARDYAYGPWMTWLPRIHLSGFEEHQVRELVTKWLDNNRGKITLFFAQLDVSPSLKEMLTIPLLAALTVLVFKQTDKLPENKTRLYDIFTDLHNGGWDLAKSVQRPSRFSAAEKMYVLKRLAASIHKVQKREIRESEAEETAKSALKNVEWSTLRDELLRDGLVIELGSMMSFAHLSFQEFLTAKYLLGDMGVSQLKGCCDQYLKGSDWWYEVLCFYIDLVGRPHETREWIDERQKAIGPHAGARGRAEILKRHLTSSFPFAK